MFTNARNCNAISEARRFVSLQAAKEELLARQAEESRYWDTLRFEEAMQKVQYREHRY